MQHLAKDTELPGRSTGTASAVDLPFSTVFLKEEVYATTRRMLELAVKDMKLQVCLSVCQLTPYLIYSEPQMHSVH